MVCGLYLCSSPWLLILCAPTLSRVRSVSSPKGIKCLRMQFFYIIFNIFQCDSTYTAYGSCKVTDRSHPGKYRLPQRSEIPDKTGSWKYPFWKQSLQYRLSLHDYNLLRLHNNLYPAYDVSISSRIVSSARYGLTALAPYPRSVAK